MQQLVLFDLDDTLVDRSDAVAAWVTLFATRYHLDEHGRSQLFRLVQKRASPRTFQEIRSRFGLAPSASSLWSAYCSDIAAAVSCPADLLARLDRLRAAGWLIGIATNGACDIQSAKLDVVGLRERVHGVSISEAVGARKPETRLFEEAALACGTLLSSGGWMVGDSPESDIWGGRRAGLRTIWISRGRPWPDHLDPPDRTVPNARSAMELLLTEDSSRGRV
jgi:putative hydrolase of the HAD superfamily